MTMYSAMTTTPGQAAAEALAEAVDDLEPFAVGVFEVEDGSDELLGLSLSALPCGLLYGALVAAASAGSALAGALAMAAFALGTVPALVGVGLLGRFFGRRWAAAPGFRLAGAALFLLLGVLYGSY